MGLDMHLEGRTWPKSEDTEDDYGRYKELAYWRNHPNLHGYFVQTFANGVDECQLIDLSKADLEKVVEAVKADALPETRGFFFGQSSEANQGNTLDQIEKAIAWLEGPGVRRVVYRASW